MQGISKFYPGVVALNKVDLDVCEGEVHALLGENGAGKSTLIKVLSGAVRNDEGRIEINGNTFEHMTPLVARENGVEVIYQEYNLIPGLSVAENVCLGSQMHGIVDKKQQIAKTQEIFDRYNIHLDPKALVGSLPPAKQQLVEITKAISKDPKIIVMDEPTAQLTMAEVENLYRIISALKDQHICGFYFLNCFKNNIDNLCDTFFIILRVNFNCVSISFYKSVAAIVSLGNSFIFLVDTLYILLKLLPMKGCTYVRVGKAHDLETVKAKFLVSLQIVFCSLDIMGIIPANAQP